MCGDLEEDDGVEGNLYQRFLVRGQALLAGTPAAQDELNDYLNRLFKDLLRRCVDDADAVPLSDSYRRMAMQSVVLARLAGFIAGHVALNEDPLRKLLEASMLGYGEAEAPARQHGHEHEHEHPHPAR